jgi:hypothetical protein
MRVLVCAADRHGSTAHLGRPIDYQSIGPVRYRRELLAQGMERFVNPQLVIGAVAGLGLADGLTGDVRNLLGREPIALDRFIADHVAAWRRPRPEPDGRQASARPMQNQPADDGTGPGLQQRVFGDAPANTLAAPPRATPHLTDASATSGGDRS